MVSCRLMPFFVRIIAMTVVILAVAACDCTPALEITSIQKSDKKLACKDLILEINEAEYYRSQAAESRKITIGELFMPTCWISGYVNGQQAIKSADARIDYLGHIYDLLDCGGMQSEGDDEEDMPVLHKPLHSGQTMKHFSSDQMKEDAAQGETSGSAATKKDQQGRTYRPVILPQRK